MSSQESLRECSKQSPLYDQRTGRRILTKDMIGISLFLPMSHMHDEGMGKTQQEVNFSKQHNRTKRNRNDCAIRIDTWTFGNTVGFSEVGCKLSM